MSLPGHRLIPRGRGSYLLVAAAAACLALLWVLLRPAGGLRGAYHSRTAGGGEILVHTRIDRGIDFAVSRRIDAAYLFHWDVERWGLSEERPPYVVRWSGVLQAPESGKYGFSVDARGEAALALDGVPIDLRPGTMTVRDLRAGLHPITLEYRSEAGEAGVVLRWRRPGGSLRPIPSSNLGADGAAIEGGRARRLAGWVLLAAGVLAALFAWARARHAGATPRAADASAVSAGGRTVWTAANRAWLALGAILALAALLRFHDYALAPFHDEAAGEYQHAWEGWSLLHTGSPASWSRFAGFYPQARVEGLRWFGSDYNLVRPSFDHPPLFSILVGIVTSLSGASHFLESSLPVIRLVPIFLSLAGILLLHRLALLYGASERGALLAALVYAVLPVIVVSHRLVKAENLLAPLFMGAILLAERHARSGKARDAALLGLVCGLSIWTKTTGVAVVATVMVLLLSRRRYRGTALALLVTGGLAALYLAYAWAYDFGVFLEVVRAQAESHWSSLEGFLDLLQSRVVDAPFGRGWYLWLLLCAGVAAFRKERALLLPLAIYAGLVVLMADFRALHGSYRIPLYPFLCVAAGIYLEEMIEASDLSRVFPFAVTAVLAGMLLALPPGLAQSQTGVLLFAVPAVAPFVVRLARDSPPTARIARLATLVLLALLLLTSVAVVGGLTEIDSTGSRRWR